jgi:transposase
MTKRLKRLGFVHKKPKGIPAKADAAGQRRFVTETLLPLIRASREDCPLYCVDAAHPAYPGRPAHGGIRKGQTRELKSNHGPTHLKINGALGWHDRSILPRQEEKIPRAAMIALFADIAARHPVVTAIPGVIDNAKYNVSREIRAGFARCRSKPVYLPSYAPTLNLIERFWRLLKRIVLYNKYYPKRADFRAAFAALFANSGRWKHEIETLITANFPFIGSPKNGIP